MPPESLPPVHVTVAVNQATWDRVDEFGELLDRLEAFGYDVHIQSPRNGNYSLGGYVVDEAVAVTILVGASIGRSALSAIEEVSREFFARKLRNAVGLNRDEPEVVEIHAPRGDGILSRVEIREEPTRSAEPPKRVGTGKPRDRRA